MTTSTTWEPRVGNSTTRQEAFGDLCSALHTHTELRTADALDMAATIAWAIGLDRHEAATIAILHLVPPAPPGAVVDAPTRYRAAAAIWHRRWDTIETLAA